MVNKSYPNAKTMAIQVLVPLPRKDRDCDAITVFSAKFGYAELNWLSPAKFLTELNWASPSYLPNLI